ncbi:MAG: helix-turn-helix domain-containing protein [[Clostridium] scindens]|uniref:helix-turn-helix domain-containing protein n=1 Tax=Clostridium scindens (strain JCM 10418 / VPI 12708) TaxID=29347 RepID=UPI0039917687
MTLVDKIRTLAKQMDMSLPQLEVELGLGNGTISRWKTSSPNTDKLQKIADYFNVSMDYLLDRETQLSKRDEKDIAKRLETALTDLEDSQNALMFSGEPLDDETRELLKASLENSIRIAKINAKQKYTPKKYRKEND